MLRKQGFASHLVTPVPFRFLWKGGSRGSLGDPTLITAWRVMAMTMATSYVPSIPEPSKVNLIRVQKMWACQVGPGVA